MKPTYYFFISLRWAEALTQKDYYYLSGDTRGIYPVDSATAFSKTTDDVYTSSDGTKGFPIMN